MRLIDADALWMEIIHRMDYCDDILEIIESMPIIEPERKKGKWITKSTGGEMFDCCSVCGYVEWDNPKSFCPNCGADMRGEQDESD